MANPQSADIEAQDEAAREEVRALRRVITEADSDTMRLLLTEARTHNGWQDRDVSEETLRQLYDMAKMGPTSMNQQPMRLIFVKSAENKEKLAALAAAGNKPKVLAAPVCAIVGYDLEFYERLADVFPPNPNAREIFADKPDVTATHAFRNGTLQGAWFMIAARALGLDVGAMSGYDHDGVDQAFFAGTAVKSNFLCNLGYADETKIFRRLPRLPFDEVASII
ncbi:MAG: malonic semialdehyde reductase [Pseudomonadota bacterium]